MLAMCADFARRISQWIVEVRNVGLIYLKRRFCPNYGATRHKARRKTSGI